MRTSYSAQKARLEKEKTKIQKQIEALQAKQRKPIIKSIVRTMQEFELTPEDIASAWQSKPATRAARKPATAPKRVIPPKYRHPETGATWTGRGKAPRWVSDAEAAGTPRTAFLIDQPTAVE